MDCLHKPLTMRNRDAPAAHYDSEKLRAIREKISLVFGRACTWDDRTLSERYNITADGDLIMILK